MATWAVSIDKFGLAALSLEVVRSSNLILQFYSDIGQSSVIRVWTNLSTCPVVLAHLSPTKHSISKSGWTLSCAL